MNKEILDRLLIDRALGALDSDTKALVDDYLAHHPDAQTQYEATCEVTELSRNLLREEGTEAPPLRFPQKSTVRRRMIFPNAVGLAASLLICFYLGKQFPTQPSAPPPLPMTAHAENDSRDDNMGIWSLKRFHSPDRPVRSTQWKWTSPVRQPELIDKGELL